jgi:leucyl-tRNA synthetase
MSDNTDVSTDEGFEHFLNHVKSEFDNNGIALFDQLQDELASEGNERVIVLLIHLYCETFLNAILVKNKVNLEKLTNFEQNWNFTRKREILWSMDFINEKVNNDLKLINSIRNNLTHKLQPDRIKIQNQIKQFEDYVEEICPKLSLARQAQYCMNDTLSFLVKEMADFLTNSVTVLLEKKEESNN